MIIYNFYLFSVGIFYLLSIHLQKKISHIQIKKVFSFILGIEMFLIMGLRSPSVGKDLENYFILYNSISNISIFETSTEPGFVLFLKLLNLFGVGEQGFILLTSLIISVSISWFIYKYSKNIFLSFFLHVTIGLFAFSLSGVRQSLAVSLILIAIYFTLNKKWIKAGLVNLIAISAHYSAIIYLPFILLGYLNIKDFKKIKYRTYIYFIIIFTLIFISVNTNWISNAFRSFDVIDTYYTNYLDKDLNLIYIFTLSSIPILLFIVFKIKGKWWLKNK